MKFSAEIFIIGINPYVFVPEDILRKLFLRAGKEKGHIPVKIKTGGKTFLQTLVRYSGEWRLYLNTAMRKVAGKEPGEITSIDIEYDSAVRNIDMHPKLKAALNKNKKAAVIFENLSPSLQKEIKRYINSLKTEESVKRNILKAISFLTGGENFIGRKKP